MIMRSLVGLLCCFILRCASAEGTQSASDNVSAECTIMGAMGNWTNSTFASEAEETVAFFSTTLIQPVALAFMATLVLATVMERLKISCIPESAVVIVCGAVLGYVLDTSKLISHGGLLEANAPLVNLVFLPLIIFDSGWSLRSKDFAAQFSYILVFAVIGTFINTFAVGSMIVATGSYHGITDMRTAFTFASLIAATDPVATLTTYSALNVEPLLHIFVFGESTINDAVAIVTFDIMNGPELFETLSDGELPATQILEAIAMGIGQKLVGSILVGVFLAVCYTFVLKIGDMRHANSFEILYVVTSCYLTFATAERLHCSGIIAVLFCGVFMGIYAKPHFSEEGRVLSSFFIKEMATLADMGIFLLVGMDTTLLNVKSLNLSLWVMLFCLIGRAIATFPCGFAVNCIKKWSAGKGNEAPLLLPTKYIFMMWHAGLRGGIALVLCLEMGDWVDKQVKQELINTTVVVVLCFLIVFGGSTEAFLKYLDIPMGMVVDEGYLYDKSLPSFAHRFFEVADSKVFSPMLKPSAENEKEAPMELRERMAQLTRRARGMYWFKAALGEDDEEDETAESE